MLRAVSAWLGERITPRNPRWMTMVRSEAVQRMALAAREKAPFPSLLVAPAFSLRQSSLNAVTRGFDASRTSLTGDGLLTAKGVPPPSCLGTSATGASAEPKTAGNVEVVGTSLRAEMILDQQLSVAFQTGRRHSLDESDHDAMFDLSENEA